MICVDCGAECVNSGGCWYCPNCGWSPCSKTLFLIIYMLA